MTVRDMQYTWAPRGKSINVGRRICMPLILLKTDFILPSCTQEFQRTPFSLSRSPGRMERYNLKWLLMQSSSVYSILSWRLPSFYNADAILISLSDLLLISLFIPYLFPYLFQRTILHEFLLLFISFFFLDIFRCMDVLSMLHGLISSLVSSTSVASLPSQSRIFLRTY